MTEKRDWTVALMIIALTAWLVTGCFSDAAGPPEAEEEHPSFAAEEQQPLEDEPPEVLDETPKRMFTHEPLPDDVIRLVTGVSWQEGAPVALEELHLVRVWHWDFDGEPQQGELIVHRELAEEVTEIFEEIFMAEFPVSRIRLIDHYGADDHLSMADNNTSALNVREVEGVPGRLSRHSYGVAIDINPVQNPYVRGERVLPEEGRHYVHRDDLRPGMITEGDAVWQAFVSRGWTWGGQWSSLKDYQHFEKPLEEVGL